MFRSIALLLVLGLFFSGCSSMRPYLDSPQYEDSRNRFEHPSGYRNDKGFFELLGLAGAFMTRDKDPAETDGFPLLDPTLSEPKDDAGSDVVWIGHASLLFRHEGVRVLTDPVFSDRASPFSFSGPKRVVPPAYTPEALPEIDILLVSHSHYDHLDMPGLKKLAALQPDIRVVVPLGLERYLRKAGFSDVTEIDWWQETDRNGIVITATPVRHWSSRSMFDRNKTLWAGFMIRFADGYKFYFAGDTGYSDDFAKTRARLGAPNFAAIPIGAYEPREFMRESHCTPEEAVQIFRDLGAGRAVGVHWGTFKLTLEPLAEPPERLRAALRQAGLAENSFRALIHGERWDLP